MIFQDLLVGSAVEITSDRPRPPVSEESPPEKSTVRWNPTPKIAILRNKSVIARPYLDVGTVSGLPGATIQTPIARLSTIGQALGFQQGVKNYKLLNLFADSMKFRVPASQTDLPNTKGTVSWNHALPVVLAKRQEFFIRSGDLIRSGPDGVAFLPSMS